MLAHRSIFTRRNPSRQRMGVSGVIPGPAPVKGLNTRDALTSMNPADAIELTNWFPRSDRLVVRPGYVGHGTGVGSGAVETLFEYQGTSSNDLIAAGGGAIYNVTTAGAGTSLQSGFSEDRWQVVPFNDVALLFNGTDAPQTYNGTTIAASSWSGSGLTASNLIQGTVFGQRVFAVEKATGSAWYGAPGAITGTMNEFDVSQYASGGFLMAVGTWSRDSGSGVDDYLALFFSTGQVLVYTGTNPATDFALVGTFKTAQPIGRRCLMEYGGELVVITKSGYVPLSFIMSAASLDQLDNHPIWGRVRTRAIEMASDHSGNFGWEGVLTEGAAYFNIPTAENSISEQLVLNPASGAWARYSSTEVQPQTWATLNGEVYVGGLGGNVFKHTGASDDGSDIQAVSRGAFFYPTAGKREAKVTAFRPVLSSDAELIARIRLDVDFAQKFNTNQITIGLGQVGSLWDVAEWDVAEWGGDPNPQTTWYSLNGRGHALSLRLELEVNGQIVEWFANQFLAEAGGSL